MAGYLICDIELNRCPNHEVGINIGGWHLKPTNIWIVQTKVDGSNPRSSDGIRG